MAHTKLLADADRLLPDNQLCVHFEIEILPQPPPSPPPRRPSSTGSEDSSDEEEDHSFNEWLATRRTPPPPPPISPLALCSTDNLRAAMLDDFVDLTGSSSSVVLVFSDGSEQPCHTFPLAARKAHTPTS
jgi:hypothetical protein